MKRIILFLIGLVPIVSKAQTDLVYNKRFVESENKWVAFHRDTKDSTYQYGFIYIDSQAGLTLNLEGTFKVNGNNVFVPTHSINKDDKTNIKVRLEANQVRVAWIPSSRFTELQIPVVPDWLKFYRTDTTSVAHLYRWGFMYNDYGESEKALTYLEPAMKIDPKFKGLQFELAFAYNALQQYLKAIPILQGMIADDPDNCNNYKELSFSQAHSKQLSKAAESYKAGIPHCSTPNVKAEMAYNIAQGYYNIKDKENFKLWADEANKWIDKTTIYAINLNKMQADLIK